MVQKGYAGIAGLDEDDFRKRLEPLRQSIDDLEMTGKQPQEGYVPFVIIVNSGWVDGEKAMQRVERKNKTGFSVMDSYDIIRFKPIEGVTIPDGMAYLLADIDTGKQTLNVTPNEALPTILQQNRSPLTLEEGIALITHHPDVLSKNNGFSLLASRCGDRRVTALWISDGRPKLGWCWAGNPHTWLGSASCGGRQGVPTGNIL